MAALLATGKENAGAGNLWGSGDGEAGASAAGQSAMDGRALARSLDKIFNVLQSKTKAEWTDRVAAMESLRALAEGGAASNEEFLPGVVRLRDALTAQVQDLRSSIVKEACATLAALAQAFREQAEADAHASGVPRPPAAWAAMTVVLADTCMRQTCVTIKVISEAAHFGLRALVCGMAPLGSQKLLAALSLAAQRDKAAPVRLVAVETVDLALREWRAMSAGSSKRLMDVREALRSAVQDSDEHVRRVARLCFWALHARAPDIADSLLKTLDAATQRRIRDARATAAPVPERLPSPTHESLSPAPAPAANAPSSAVVSPTPELSPERAPPELVPPPELAPPPALDTAARARHDSADSGSSAASHGEGAEVAARHRPVRAQRVAAEDSAQQQHGAGARREYNAAEYAERVPARRMAGPQRVVAAATGRSGPQRAAQSANVGTATGQGAGGGNGNGAVRVAAAAQRVSSRRSEDDEVGSVSGSSMGSSHSRALSVVALDRRLTDLATAGNWTRRLEATQAIMAAHEEGGLPASFASRLVPKLCERASDPHHKVTEAVVRLIVRLLRELSKHFGDHLKLLLPALLAGRSDKPAVRAQCDEALAVCGEVFSHDSLCAVLSPICRRKGGDKLRVSCMEVMAQLVPTAHTYFASPNNVRSLLLRLEHSLTVHRAEPRATAEDLVAAVFRANQRAFALAVQSSELPAALRRAAVSAVAKGVKDITDVEAEISRLCDEAHAARGAGAGAAFHERAAAAASHPASRAAAGAESDLGSHNQQEGAEVPPEAHDGTLGQTQAVIEDGDGPEHVIKSSPGPSVAASSPQAPQDPSTPSKESLSDGVTSNLMKELMRLAVSPPESVPLYPMARRGGGAAVPRPAGEEGLDSNCVMGTIMSRIGSSDPDEAFDGFRAARSFLAGDMSNLRRQVAWDKWFLPLLDGCLEAIAQQPPSSSRLSVAEADLCDLAVDTVSRLARVCKHRMAAEAERVVKQLLALREKQIVDHTHRLDDALRKVVDVCEPCMAAQVLLNSIFLLGASSAVQMALREFTRILQRMSTAELLEVLPSALPALHSSLTNADATVRHAAVLGFATLLVLLGSDAPPELLSGLSTCQRKLVLHYEKRERPKLMGHSPAT